MFFSNPFLRRPGKPLALMTCLVVALALFPSFTPLVASLSFRPLPGLFSLLLAAMPVTYLRLVELVKHRAMKKS